MAYLSEQHQQISRQIVALPQDALDELADFLNHLEQKFGTQSPAAQSSGEMDAESSAWLTADLAGDLPEYNWGQDGIPAVQPIRFVPGEGFVIGEVK
jgi:hypothetical protein